MKLPGGDKALVDLEKLTNYCLSPVHPRGKHKARVFQSACGLTEENAEFMLQQLLDAAEQGEAVETSVDAFGRRYMIECVIAGPTGRALVRTAWIIRRNEDYPRFVSAYVI